MLLGLVLLYYGAEGLVGGGARLALRLGVTPLVVGLTVVAYGTGSPEMVVSVRGALAGQGGLAIGNVVGSNIANIALILGLSSLVRPTRVDSQLVKREMPVLVGSSVLFVGLIHDGVLSRADGLILLAVLVAYTTLSVTRARRATTDPRVGGLAARLPKSDASMGKPLLWIVGGLILLVLGGRFFVDGAVGMARRYGLSEAVIGLTIVALGTSLPELATSMLAAFRKEDDIAVGNVVGSNLFNLLGILGVASVVRPMDAAGIRGADLGVMLAVTVVLLPLMRTGFVVSRREAGLLLAGYGVYVYQLLPKT